MSKTHAQPSTVPVSALRRLLDSEAAGGMVLIGAATLAVLLANGPLGGVYHDWVHFETGPVLVPGHGPMTVEHWINDGLMAVFFLLVGLEIKREFVDGRLATWPQRRLPILAAAAGMIVPALVYLALAGGEPALRPGWAIPAATDIAFAMGVLALLGKRAPTSLKLFLLTVAIVDDLGAVAIIALAYTRGIDPMALAAAAAILMLMLGLGRMGVRMLTPFILLAGLLWYAVLLSGVHATVAGVLAAAAIPVIKTPGAPDSPDSPLHRLEHALAPWVAFLVVPLFGFANAGVALGDVGAAALVSPLTLGIAAGLFAGKQVGIFAAVWIAVKSGFAAMPRGATWRQVHAVSVLCGIGFTMSLFIGSLAFPGQPALAEEAKLGILIGSIASALVGFALLRLAPAHHDQEGVESRICDEIVQDGDMREHSSRPPANP